MPRSFVADILRIAGHVGVRVGQARQNCRVRQIDQAITGRAGGLREGTDADDLASVDHDGLVGEGLAAADIEQLCRREHDSAVALRSSCAVAEAPKKND